MLVYIPVTNLSGKGPVHDCMEIESEKAIFHKATRYSDSIHYYGIIYNGDSIFKSPDGVFAWWNHDFKAIKENEIKAENIKWKHIN